MIIGPGRGAIGLCGNCGQHLRFPFLIWWCLAMTMLSTPCVYRAGASTISWRVVQFLRRLEGVLQHLRGNGENPPSDNFRENTLEETAGSVLSSIYGFALKTSIVSHTLCLPERLLLNAGPLVGCFAMFCYLESCTFWFFLLMRITDPRRGIFPTWVRHSPSFSFEGYLTCLQLKSFFNTGVGGSVTVNLSWAASHLPSSCTRLPKPLDEVITATLPEARKKSWIPRPTCYNHCNTATTDRNRNRRGKLAVPGGIMLLLFTVIVCTRHFCRIYNNIVISFWLCIEAQKFVPQRRQGVQIWHQQHRWWEVPNCSMLMKDLQGPFLQIYIYERFPLRSDFF